MELGSFQDHTVKEQQFFQVKSGWTYEEKILQDESGEALEQMMLWNCQSLDILKT